MAEFLSLRCPKCSAHYAVPDVYQPHILGFALLCPGCRSSWEPMPDPGKTGPVSPSRVDLRKFRSKASEGVGAGPTLKVPVARPEVARTSLKVIVIGPEGRVTGTFDLGSKRFVIGSGPCHLRMPGTSIPHHAIEVRKEGPIFIVSGIDGFSLPLGSIYAPMAEVRPGQTVKLALVPYKLELMAESSPGTPIKELAEIVRSAAPPASQPAPQAAQGIPGRPRVEQLQELAAEVVTAPRPFSSSTSLLDEVDADMTVTDFAAAGIHSRQSMVDPFQHVDVHLEQADGPHEGRRFKVTRTPLLIGRADIGLSIKDPRVSGKHAQLDVGGPQLYTLKDLASTNGTTVNGRPLSVARLNDGDLISFGGAKFKFIAQLKNR